VAVVEVAVVQVAVVQVAHHKLASLAMQVHKGVSK
jgi:hypothetical protein